MSLPTVTLFNLSAVPITLDQLGVTIPVGGSVPGPTFASVQQIIDDPDLTAAISAGSIRVDITGGGGLSSGQIQKTVAQSQAILQPLHDLDIKHNVNAGIAPTPTDDQQSGYSVMSRWLVPATGQQWYCIDDSAGAALWLPYASGDWQSIQTGRSSSTSPNVFYRGINGMSLDAGAGGIPVREGNLRWVSWTRSNSSPAALEVLNNGVVIALIPSFVSGPVANFVNIPVSFGVMSFRNFVGGNITTRVQISAHIQGAPTP